MISCFVWNRTSEEWKKELSSGEASKLPDTVASFASIEWETAGDGDVTYAGASGKLRIQWVAQFSQVTPLGRYTADTQRSVGTLSSEATMTGAANPLVCPSVRVAPGTSSSSATNVVATPDYEALRAKIVASAQAEAAAWENKPEAQRQPLRLKYLDALSGDNRAQVGAFKGYQDGGNGGACAWCGVFGTWSAREARNTGVAWNLGQRPTGMLYSTDMQKLHRGDIAHVQDSQAYHARVKAWEESLPSRRAAVAKEHPEWDVAQVEKAVQGTRPAAPNHHVLVLSAKSNVIPTIEGNAGRDANSKNAVLRGSRWRLTAPQNASYDDRLDAFYCTVPDVSCLCDAAAKTGLAQTECPVANGAPCRRPDK